MTPPPKPLALLVLTLLATPARADAPAPAPAPIPAPRALGLRLDADLDLGSPMGMSESRLSLGVGGRLGWRLEVGPVWLQPEVGGSYTAFTTYTPRGSPNPLMPDPLFCEVCLHLITEHPARVFGGLRLGGAGLISGVIEPALFGHAGYGWVTSGVDGYRSWSGSINPAYLLDRSAPTFDFGIALDVNAFRQVRFGVHGAYDVVAYPTRVTDRAGFQGAVSWLSYGLHLGVAL